MYVARNYKFIPISTMTSNRFKYVCTYVAIVHTFLMTR